MTVYSASGFELGSLVGGPVQDLAGVTLDIHTEGGDQHLRLRYTEDGSGGAEVTVGPSLMVYRSPGDNDLMPEGTELFAIAWTDADGGAHVSTVLALTFADGTREKDGVFVIAGDPLPEFTSTDEVAAFMIGSVFERLDHGEELAFPLADIPGVVIHGTTDPADEEDSFVFSDGEADVADAEFDETIELAAALADDPAPEDAADTVPDLLADLGPMLDTDDGFDDGLF